MRCELVDNEKESVTVENLPYTLSLSRSNVIKKYTSLLNFKMK
jgi:hypothetical protein